MTEIKRLRALIEELREENLQLREALTPPVLLPPEWGLTGQQAALLLTLYASPTVVRFEALALALGKGGEPITDVHVVVIVSKVRRKLQNNGAGIRIINRWGVGYGLDDRSRAVIASALQGGTKQVAA